MKIFKKKKDLLFEDATFDDIEWNYDKEVVRKALDNDIDLRIKIQELEEKNKTFEDYNKDLNNQLDKLEEENKKLKEDYDILDKFDKKIEYFDDYKIDVRNIDELIDSINLYIELNTNKINEIINKINSEE